MSRNPFGFVKNDMYTSRTLRSTCFPTSNAVESNIYVWNIYIQDNIHAEVEVERKE